MKPPVRSSAILAAVGITARRCAICGRSDSSPRLGGISAATFLTNALRKAGAKLKAPGSRYLHVLCARNSARLFPE